MARTQKSISYEMLYELGFKTAIRGHHVYKDVWTPCNEDVLICKKDDRQEAIEFDKNAVGVYNKTSTDDQLLVGHIPIELSRIMAGFLATSITNSLIVKPCGKRRREIGLIIPGSYYQAWGGKACDRTRTRPHTPSEKARVVHRTSC